ncbi:MAG: hypothetical protein K2I49_02475, partial [Ureaplasma sp.]|nr:hypothetical protein [Ureaplasma sp.]
INNKFNIKLNYKNLDVQSWKSYNKWPYRINSNQNKTVYGNIDRLPKDVKLNFYDHQVNIKLPFNLQTITRNIRNYLNKTIFLNTWTDDFTNIANQMIEEIKSTYIPTYLWDAIKINYQPDLRKSLINWTISYTTLDNIETKQTQSTKISLPDRTNLANVYSELLNYIQTPIQLYSNSSSKFDDNNIPTYINKKFDEELLKPNPDLPQSYGYVFSKVLPDDIKLGSSKNYYKGNEINNNIDWSNNNRIITNKKILLNYISMIMNNFWNKYGSNFEGSNAQASISFETDQVSKQNFINIKFTFDNIPNELVLNNQPSPWFFKIPVQTITTSFARSANIEDRLILTGSDVPFLSGDKVFVRKQTDQVPATSNDGFRIVPSDGKKDGGTKLFFSSVDLTFNVNDTQNEIIKVNGIEIPVLNLVANTKLSNPIDNRGENDNNTGFKKYLIQIFDSGAEVYTVTIYIGNSSTPLDIAFYAWDPNNNPDQKNLITQKFPDGSDNPNYIPQLDPKTGTIQELLWVNQKPDVAMWPDPYDKNGKPTGNMESGWAADGFIASGTVINKGIKAIFDNETGKTVRTGLSFDATNGFQKSSNPTSNPNLTNVGATTQIEPSSPNQPYNSFSGIWNYSIKSRFPNQAPDVEQFGTYGQYFVNVVDQSSIDSTGVVLNKFSSTLPANNIVVPFWETYHGFNLKNYLTSNYGLKETDIEKLSYNDVLGYWNEYCFSGFNLNLNQNTNIN